MAHGADFCSSTQLTFIDHQLHAEYSAGYRELLLEPDGLELTSPVPSPGPFRDTQPPSWLVKYSETVRQQLVVPSDFSPCRLEMKCNPC